MLFVLPLLLTLQGTLFSSLTKCINASSVWLADERVRTLDSAPVLGRGYSMRTNSYLSTCLVAKSTSVPSFNYKFERFFLDPSETIKALSLQVHSAPPGSIARDILENALVEVKAQKKAEQIEHGDLKYYKVASMHVDQYYSSVMEDTATLSSHAQVLLQEEDYEGFFKACGTYFIRSIRRTREVSVRFEFESAMDSSSDPPDNSQALAFSTAIDSFTSGISFESAFAGLTDSAEMASLRMVIEATGLGHQAREVANANAGSLILSDISSLNDVLENSYNLITSGNQQDGSGEAGKVHSIEIVPWSNNPIFQTLAKVHSHEIYETVPFEEIPNVKANGTCQRLDHTKDMFDKCCATSETKTANTSAQFYCQPQRLLSPVKMKHNMEQNGEFVATLAGIDRKNKAVMSQLQDCVQTLNNNFFAENEFKYLKSRGEESSSNFPRGVTVKELKMILDPSNDLSLVRLLGFENEEYRLKFYEPCLSSLYSDGDIEGAKFFMAHPYSHHEECTFYNCAFEGMRWDRENENGGCVRGLLTDGPVFTEKTNAPQCAKRVDQNTMQVKCVRDQEMLLEMQAQVRKCWAGLPIMNSVGPDKQTFVPLISIIERYCGSLELDSSLGEADFSVKEDIKQMSQNCDGYHVECDDGTPCGVGRYCNFNSRFCEKKVRIDDRCNEDSDCFAHNGFCDVKLSSGKSGKFCVPKQDIGGVCEEPRECKLADAVVNVALNQETSQSGEEGDNKIFSKRAVDGSAGGNAVTTQTITESNPWWEVGLSNNYIIRRINIYHGDITSDQITLEIFGDNNDRVWIYNIENNDNSSLTEVIVNSEVIGRRVRLSLEGDQKLLSLKEVEVMGVLPRRCDGGKCSCLVDGTRDECEEGTFCDPHGVDGLQQCSPPKAPGKTCSENSHCQSNVCDMELGQCSCLTHGDCDNLHSQNDYCDLDGTMQCLPKKGFWMECTHDYQCDSYPLNDSECHGSRCRPTKSFDYCIKTEDSYKWGWPAETTVVSNFTDAENACKNYWFMAIKKHPYISGAFSVNCGKDLWFNLKANKAGNDEECMVSHNNGKWMGGSNRAAVYYFQGKNKHIINLAPLGTASQISTSSWPKYAASVANDGDIRQNEQYSHTANNGNYNTWWGVTFEHGHCYRIHAIIIYTRAYISWRLDGLGIQVFNKSGTKTWQSPHGWIVGHNRYTIELGMPSGIVGNQVRVAILDPHKHEAMSNHEVAILGENNILSC